MAHDARVICSWLGGSPMSIGVHQFVRLFVKRFLAAIVLAVMLTGGAAAGPVEDAVAAYDRGDYAAALRLFRPLAEQGNVAAQYGLGVFYRDGSGAKGVNTMISSAI